MGWVLSWPVNGIAASNSGAGSRPRAAMVAASRGGVELNRSCQLLSSRLFPERASMAFFSAAPDRGWSAREKHSEKKGEGDLHTAEASLCDAILQLSPVVHRRRRPCWLPRRGFRHGVERRHDGERRALGTSSAAVVVVYSSRLVHLRSIGQRAVEECHREPGALRRATRRGLAPHGYSAAHHMYTWSSIGAQSLAALGGLPHHLMPRVDCVMEGTVCRRCRARPAVITPLR